MIHEKLRIQNEWLCTRGLRTRSTPLVKILYWNRGASRKEQPSKVSYWFLHVRVRSRVKSTVSDEVNNQQLNWRRWARSHTYHNRNRTELNAATAASTQVGALSNFRYLGELRLPFLGIREEWGSWFSLWYKFICFQWWILVHALFQVAYSFPIVMLHVVVTYSLANTSIHSIELPGRGVVYAWSFNSKPHDSDRFVVSIYHSWFLLYISL